MFYFLLLSNLRNAYKNSEQANINLDNSICEGITHSCANRQKELSLGNHWKNWNKSEKDDCAKRKQEEEKTQFVS